MQTIFTAVDGSARTEGVFDLAAELARAMKARMVLYRALDASPDFSPAGARTANPLPGYLEREARAQLASVAARAPDVPCELRIEQAAQPWRAIIAAAEAARADLIVIGSHGYHGWDRVLGTTAGRVADRARRHVLVVHDRAREASAPSPGTA